MSTSKESTVEFLTQACCGTIMALFRMGIVDPDSYKDQLVVLMSRYLNNCWNALLRGDDPVVISTYAAINHDRPNCVFKKFFDLGTHAFPERCPEELLKYSPDDPQHLEDARIEVSELLKAFFSENIPDDFWNHECDGLSLEEERSIWAQNGCATEEFFVLSGTRSLLS
ncbi:hypothetical protein C3747_274g8 [Trypanosoma cruzi]|uniref:Uncharacterized protein n=2 Tax=Trypanosoma cruzi TaxID=5693 RepID=Q4DM23_TRYCC|nr:hypothetical protein, conserved [Trypanosoma cruzi]EAN93578.1 hypothetical protein, conserved [Trypanosoma cruzi]KAF8296576.1 hypothetical protein TcYC6_0084600 [Trypanosoma cruzi]PWU94823.1 hypothetical protein C3747_274g8 [Trypanosoma cruzi]|eukprot:XP_815429.1 hypothetical protein [Trypanosoma cruzi strain CL Brener]